MQVHKAQKYPCEEAHSCIADGQFEQLQCRLDPGSQQPQEATRWLVGDRVAGSCESCSDTLIPASCCQAGTCDDQPSSQAVSAEQQEPADNRSSWEATAAAC